MVAGEASGSALGSGLIRALRARAQVRVIGVGGADMAGEGAELLFDARELSVMGLSEVVRHLPRLLRLRRRLRRWLLEARPDVFVGIDLPDFNLSVARWLRVRGVAALQYVSPSVWAWREGRVKKIDRAVDEVLCLLPFEPAFYERHGVRARFVGHPLADRFAAALPKEPARESLGLDPNGRFLAVLPGSRLSEVTALGDTFARALARLHAARPDLAFLVPVADPSLRAPIEAELAEHGVPARLFDRRGHEVIAAADTVLLASGTAALEAMLIGRPMVVAYRVSRFTAFVMRRVTPVRIGRFSLPNVLAGEDLVPELIQDALTDEALAGAVLAQLEAPDGNAALLARFDALRAQLANGADAAAAEAVLEHAAGRAA